MVQTNITEKLGLEPESVPGTYILYGFLYVYNMAFCVTWVGKWGIIPCRNRAPTSARGATFEGTVPALTLGATPKGDIQVDAIPFIHEYGTMWVKTCTIFVL